jgi:hypothetical protein
MSGKNEIGLNLVEGFEQIAQDKELLARFLYTQIKIGSFTTIIQQMIMHGAMKGLGEDTLLYEGIMQGMKESKKAIDSIKYEDIETMISIENIH